jgi:hypothetical protein
MADVLMWAGKWQQLKLEGVCHVPGSQGWMVSLSISMPISSHDDRFSGGG